MAHHLTSRQDMLRLLNYCLVGVSGVVLALASLWAMVEYLHLFYVGAAVLSTALGTTNNFFWYEVLTFRDVKRSFTLSQLFTRWLQFNLVRASGVGISLAILTGLVEGLGVHYFLANLVGTAVAIILNYILSIGWIWRRRAVEE